MRQSSITTKIAGIDVSELASQFGTPLYVYDQAIIEERISNLSIFDNARFAVKALSNIEILKIMKCHGIKLDCVSKGELMRGLRAGFDCSELNYTCDIFDRESLEFVLENNIPVNFGSMDMISQYAPAARLREITVRINPGFGHGHNQKTNTGGPSSKHGIWHEDIPQLLELCRDSNLIVRGVHMHIGSGSDFDHLSEVSSAMKNIARFFSESVTVISCGGGLPIPYSENESRIDIRKYFDIWENIRKDLSSELGRELTLEIEPGRYLVAESGFIITELRAIKSAAEYTYYLVDAGFNNLVRPVMYGAYHDISVCITNNKESSNEFVSVVVAGPLCESGDVFTQAEGGLLLPRELPKARVGDYLIIHDTGAYGASMASNYNSKPYAAEVMILNDKVRLIRPRQTESDLLDSECGT